LQASARQPAGLAGVREAAGPGLQASARQAARLAGVRKAAVGGEDEPAVDRARVGLAEGHELAALEGAQQLDLDRARPRGRR